MSQSQIQYWLAPAGTILDGNIPANLQGPFSVTDISQMVSNGTVLTNDLVCPADGSYNWMEVEVLLVAASYGEILYYDPMDAINYGVPQVPQYMPTNVGVPRSNLSNGGQSDRSKTKSSDSTATLKMISYAALTIGLIVLLVWAVKNKGSGDVVKTETTSDIEKELFSEPKKKSVVKTVDFMINGGQTRMIQLPLGASSMTIDCPLGCKYLLLQREVSENQIDKYALINLKGSKKRRITIGVRDRFLFLSPGARDRTSGVVEIK